MVLQLQQQVIALSVELHKLQVAAAETHATAAEGSWSGGQLRQQLVAMTEQMARCEAFLASFHAAAIVLHAKLSHSSCRTDVHELPAAVKGGVCSSFKPDCAHALPAGSSRTVLQIVRICKPCSPHSSSSWRPYKRSNSSKSQHYSSSMQLPLVLCSSRQQLWQLQVQQSQQQCAAALLAWPVSLATDKPTC
jgi:hypothetical protein